MTGVYAQFAAALRAQLNGEFEAAFGDAITCSPAQARQADLDDQVITAALGETLDIPVKESLASSPVSHEFLSKVPISFARRHCLIGLADGDNGGAVAIADLTQLSQVHVLAKVLGRRLRPLFAPRDEILRTINAAYQQQTDQASRVIEQLDAEDVMDDLQRAVQNEDLLDIANRAPVIKLVNLIFFEAIKRRASDVHVHPYEDRLVVRMRVDGVLHDVLEPPKALQSEIISRIKVMGGMNIAERRIAQDGRETVELGDRLVDLRISTLPTSFGERAVIRLLDKSIRLYKLDELGMPPSIEGHFGRLIRADHGIILVTGPTGSGKSTTLYAALQELNATERNILTLEDPIEYRLEGISQTQVSDKKGMTFATGLRHVLRQDPDIIMVGEIRDAETARMAIQSALTGHLVFSTLHTNDAAGAVARLLDLGVEPYLVASSVLGVLAQRLVRRICPHCSKGYAPPADELAEWGLTETDLPGGQLARGVGCEECLQTGYLERVGIFELLELTEPIRELVGHQAKATSIKSAALGGGMTTLRASGIEKVCAGVTTMEEVVRTTTKDEL